MEELNLKELLLILKKRWWIVVSLAVVFAVASGIYSFFFIKPVYQSNASLYVFKKVDAQNGGIAYNDLMVGNQLVNDYRELVKSRMVSEIVIQELGLKDITPDSMSGKFSVTSKKDTRLIEIAATDTNPALARDIANKVAVVFQEQVVKIMQVDNVQLIDKAQEPVAPIKPNKKMNVAIAFILGMMLGLGIIFLMEYLDNTIKTPEDVVKYTGIPVIGTIPVFPE